MIWRKCSHLVVLESKQLLAESVTVLVLPLLGQEVGDRVPPCEELVTIPPDTVFRIGKLDFMRVSGGRVLAVVLARHPVRYRKCDTLCSMHPAQLSPWSEPSQL